LYEAIKNGNLGGAALDVFEKEPATGNKLAELDNVILTPHIGAQTKEAQSLAANVIGEKIIQILRGVI
jgi:D-3-phosphoglycerate dehydrogenase